MSAIVSAIDARVSVRPRPRPAFWARAWRAVDSYFDSGDIAWNRRYLIIRPAIALLVAAATILQGSSLPGREGVLIACTVAVVYNAFFALLVLRRKLYMLRVLSLLFDNLVVICASVFVFRRMGMAGYESDLWLIFITLIVSNAVYYGPVGSIVFTALWTSLVVFVTLAFYDVDSHARDQLPMRLVFFVLTGFVSFSLAHELRKGQGRLEQKSRQTLWMLANIVEARDTDAGQHLRHIEHYARALTLHLGFDEKTANEIAYAAMIHDVGKAQVPDAILKKPGPLTIPEREEMQRHTVWGHELLVDHEEFATACEVARSHHEHWDGTGYPDGLAGEAIPVAARIVAVADVYDALISERPYKHAWPPQEAIDEITRLRGSHLDPQIVDAFLELERSGALRRLEEQMRDEPEFTERLAS